MQIGGNYQQPGLSSIGNDHNNIRQPSSLERGVQTTKTVTRESLKRLRNIRSRRLAARENARASQHISQNQNTNTTVKLSLDGEVMTPLIENKDIEDKVTSRTSLDNVKTIGTVTASVVLGSLKLVAKIAYHAIKMVVTLSSAAVGASLGFVLGGVAATLIGEDMFRAAVSVGRGGGSMGYNVANDMFEGIEDGLKEAGF